MPKPLQPLPDAISNSESDSSEDGDFVPSGSGRCNAFLCAFVQAPPQWPSLQFPHAAFTVAAAAMPQIRTSAIVRLKRSMPMRVMRSNSQQQQLAAAQQELQVPSHWLSPAALFITHACGLAVAAATKRPASHAPPPATAVDDPAKKSRVRALAPSPLAPAPRPSSRASQVDALFADLLADDPPLRPRGPVGGIITAAFASGGCSAVSAAPFKASATAASASSSVAVPGVNGGALRPAALPSAMSGAGHKEVTVTSTKDFAGQLVTVTRTVAVGSEEHKKLMQVLFEPFHCICGDAVSISLLEEFWCSLSHLLQKPKGTGLESVLGLLGKPKKASTMEKSASDWIGFVQKEVHAATRPLVTAVMLTMFQGIADQLEENRKDGCAAPQISCAARRLWPVTPAASAIWKSCAFSTALPLCRRSSSNRSFLSRSARPRSACFATCDLVL